MANIKNKTQLIANGETEQFKQARTIALDCLEHALDSVEPKRLTHAKLRVENQQLHAGEFVFDLANFRRIFVVGGGKACGAMAEALEEILGSCITQGIVNVPYGSTKTTRRIELQEASHPIPDQAGVEGARRMLALAAAELDVAKVV